ncbi:MAG: hypothetical protein ACKVIH_01630 [Burkholderiales bacterium]
MNDLDQITHCDQMGVCQGLTPPCCDLCTPATPPQSTEPVYDSADAILSRVQTFALGVATGMVFAALMLWLGYTA